IGCAACARRRPEQAAAARRPGQRARDRRLSSHAVRSMKNRTSGNLGVLATPLWGRGAFRNGGASHDPPPPPLPTRATARGGGEQTEYAARVLSGPAVGNLK